MQVLVENPYAPLRERPTELLESFWSETTYYMTPMFSITSLLSQSDVVGLSPYALVDARVAIMISRLNPAESAFTKNVGALGMTVVAFHSSCVGSEERRADVAKYFKEYLPQERIPVIGAQLYDQIIVYDETEIDLELWKKLKVGGHYIFGSSKGPLSYSIPPKHFDAIGVLYPYGEATEFGWKFEEDELGLKGFEFSKLKKLI